MKQGTSDAPPFARANVRARSPARAYEESLDVARQRVDPYAMLAVRALSLLVLFVGEIGRAHV